jgi:hypothetical protein
MQNSRASNVLFLAPAAAGVTLLSSASKVGCFSRLSRAPRSCDTSRLLFHALLDDFVAYVR